MIMGSMEILRTLRVAVSETLDKKRMLEQYLDCAAAVVAGCKIDNEQLKQRFADALANGREGIK